MPTLAERLAGLPDLLVDACCRHGVPAASLAVAHGGETFETATGLLSRHTGVEATPDAVFQIGSITKLFTGALAMQLVEEGRLDLDAPVRDYLPELQLADLERRDRVLVRHLLTHTSGIDGDFFTDTGRGDDSIERYVLACAALGFLHEPGERFSYCNTGFVLLGRIIEKLRAMPFHCVFRERLLDPIGMASSGSLPEEAILHRAAVGHPPDPVEPAKEADPTATWMLPHSIAAAGATPFATARDLIAFARVFLAGGAAAGGERILRRETIDALWVRQTDVSPSVPVDGWGLAWILFDWDGHRVVGHDGGTIGQASYLRLLPDAGIALALLTNGGAGSLLSREVLDAVLGELAGVRVPPLPEPGSDVAIEPGRYTGVYERLSNRSEVRPGPAPGTLLLEQRMRRGLDPSRRLNAILQAIDAELFRVVEGAGAVSGTLVAFPGAAAGEAAGMHLGYRFNPRIAGN